MDHFRDFLRVLKPGHFIKVDIGDGHYHVPVAHSSQRFLGFVVMGTAYAPMGLTVNPISAAMSTYAVPITTKT